MRNLGLGEHRTIGSFVWAKLRAFSEENADFAHFFELMFSDEIPDTVAINESVNIAKTYEGEESAKFINGILSVVLKEKA